MSLIIEGEMLTSLELRDALTWPRVENRLGHPVRFRNARDASHSPIRLVVGLSPMPKKPGATLAIQDCGDPDGYYTI
jgi:hypothetical protein